MSQMRIIAQSRILVYHSKSNWKLLYAFGSVHTLLWSSLAVVSYYKKDDEDWNAMMKSSIAMTSLGLLYLVGFNRLAGRQISRVWVVGDKVELLNCKITNNLMIFDRGKLKRDGNSIVGGSVRYQLASRGQILHDDLFNKL